MTRAHAPRQVALQELAGSPGPGASATRAQGGGAQGGPSALESLNELNRNMSAVPAVDEVFVFQQIRGLAGLDEGLLSLSLPILVYMCTPCSDNK